MITINWCGGSCPIQAEGSFDGCFHFYFRGRGSTITVYVLKSANDQLSDPIFKYSEPYKPEDKYAAGYLEDQEVRDFLDRAYKKFYEFLDSKT